MKRLGLRARLALALVGVAVAAVGLATLIGNLGLGSRLDQAARARLASQAGHLADVTATVYGATRSWTGAAQAELTHLAELDGLRLSLRLAGGQVVHVGPAPTGTVARAGVVVHGQRLATASVSAANGSLLSTEEEQLRASLDRLHLLAAAVAAVAALIVGLLLAETLSRPLRRIRAVADRLSRGELEARVEAGSEPEVRAVGGALNRLAETLAEEEELRKEGVADLAHELRTPVNGLLSRIEAAEDGVLPLPDNLSAMHAEAVRLTLLLDDLARLADAERPGLMVEKQLLDLAEVAGAVGQGFAPRFAAAGIAFSSDCKPTWALGDPGRLGQVVANLLSNALAYTGPGGRVALSAGASAAGAFVEVIDTGIGIEPSDLRHIYTRFWRGDRSRSRARGGSGIGLAIVRELVRAHEGRIDVESTPGRGSRFRVVLPVPGQAPAAELPTPQVAAKAAPSRLES